MTGQSTGDRELSPAPGGQGGPALVGGLVITGPISWDGYAKCNILPYFIISHLLSSLADRHTLFSSLNFARCGPISPAPPAAGRAASKPPGQGGFFWGLAGERHARRGRILGQGH